MTNENNLDMTVEEMRDAWPEPLHHISNRWMEITGPDSSQFCVLFPIRGLHDLGCKACFVVEQSCSFDVTNVEQVISKFQDNLEEITSKLIEILAGAYSASMTLSNLNMTMVNRDGKPVCFIEIKDQTLIWQLAQEARRYESREETILCDHLTEAIAKVGQSAK